VKRSRRVSTLILVGTASSALLTACGDDGGSQSPRVFRDIASCVSANGKMADAEVACSLAMQQAMASHIAMAPRFTSKDQCQDVVGESAQCLAVASKDGERTEYVPRLAGFMVGKMGDDDRPSGSQGSGGSGGGGGGGGFTFVNLGGWSGYSSYPVYVDRDGFARTGTSSLGRVASTGPGNHGTFGIDAKPPSAGSAAVAARSTPSGGVSTGPSAAATASPAPARSFQPAPTVSRGGFGSTAASVSSSSGS
jgi:uncharacterized protein YgiB involved in biofilm formation